MIKYFTLFLLCLTLGLQAQFTNLERIGKVEKAIEEVSGICLVPSGHLAMINDSGNHPDVYFTDSTGKTISKICLMEITNHDWEEITYADGHIYIGDFGNNRNRRRDLCIYKYAISQSDSLSYVGKIEFQYQDQNDYPPSYKKKNYDMEAMVYYNDSLFLFSKNRTRPFTGYTYQYGIPASPGTYNLTRLDSFKTGIGDESSFWISGATISADHSELILLGYDKVWTFSNFNGSKFLKGNIETYHFKDLSQKEAVCYLNETTILITDERNRWGGGEVFKMKIKK